MIPRYDAGEIPIKNQRRRLVALMFTDMVGYSALASQDERKALHLLEEHRSIFRRIIPNYGGLENKTIGDAFFIEFGSAVDAVQCAIEVQTALYERNLQHAADSKITIRIGIHLGDVIDFEGDRYGDGVNIAARVENQTKPGGIYITRQIFDQVGQSLLLPILKVGTFQLKNIATPTDIFQVILPWERSPKKFSPFNFIHQIRSQWFKSKIQSRRQTPLLWWNLNALYAVSFTILSVFLFSIFSIIQEVKLPNALLRTPASDSTSSRIDLSQNWKFSATDPTLSGSIPQWQEYNPLRVSEYVKQMKEGKYWLKTDFELTETFKYPAIFLGMISSSHRVYLNQRWIGGSNYYAALEYYPVSNHHLKPGQKNEILISAVAPNTISPGITPIQDIGMYLGEFDQIQKDIVSNRLSYDVLRSIYAAVALILSAICMLYYLSNRKKVEYFYFGLYLLLGSLALAYYSVLVSLMDSRIRRFIKVFAFSLSSFVLLSAYFNLKKMRKAEILNNMAGILCGLVAGFCFLMPNDSFTYLKYYNGFFYFTFAYSIAWILPVTVHFLRTSLKRRFHHSSTENPYFSHYTIIIGFGMITATLQLSSPQYTNDFFFSKTTRGALQELGMLYPFLFTIFILFKGVRDYLQKSHTVLYTEAKNNLILNIVQTIEKGVQQSFETQSLTKTISEIQEQFCRFLKAERSTIYLIEKDSQGNSWLKATHVYGQHSQYSIERSVMPHSGVIGYVYKNKAALLIRDISTDLRFSQFIRARKDNSSYKTKSCMLIPLIYAGEIVGIVTLADKRNHRVFTPEDFTLMHVVAKDLALLIQNNQLQNQIRNFLAA